MYGPTETTVWSTRWRVPSDVSRVLIGKPIGNTQIYVLDESLGLVPLGSPGEVYVGGAGVGRGYFRRPDLTATSFVPDPFAARPGARLYKTGDRGKRRPDGRFVVLGRLDHQVKIRGHRIELGEVESAIAEHPGVVRFLSFLNRAHMGSYQLALDNAARPAEIASTRAYRTKFG